MNSAQPRKQRRHPRLADVVADELREEILSGALPDGSLLPKQDELIERFRVSPPSVREGLRILETEGLVTVLRGNVGGARVRHPRSERVAYMAAMVLQARQVPLHDVSVAIRELEASCIQLIVDQADRRSQALKTLRTRLDEHRARIDDVNAYVASARAFHEDLVSVCGNESIRLMVGALEGLWTAHVNEAQSPETARPFDDLAFRERSLADHEAIVAAIEAGDATGAAALLRSHLTNEDLQKRGSWLHRFVQQQVRSSSVATDH